MQKRVYFLMMTAIVLFFQWSCSHKSSKKELSENEMKAYLLVYFKDSDHALHMALSSDGLPI